MTILALATAGRAAVGIGAAGSGKTTVAAPIVDAYHAEGWKSLGVTLAWRQSHGLKQAGVGRMPDIDRLTAAGIGEDSAFALHPFLKRAAEGKFELDAKTLVVVDEIATIGTRQILEIARLQAEHGFKLIGLGDDKQARSIEAGASIDLFRRALGNDQVPEILGTIRQKRLDDREIAKLFREGNAAEALDRKEQAGLLTLTPGSYGDAIKAGVDEWERRSQANRGRDDYTIGISVPTNLDALAVGREVRRRLPLGQQWTIKASDQTGNVYDLQLVIGDKVRLFNRVNARYGEGSRGYFGENGTVAEVKAIDGKAITLERADGRIGDIAWSSLAAKGSDTVRLAYGHALTIDARQGDTLTDHITILPNGTRGVDAHKMYPADTRNREDSVLIVSQGAEKEALRDIRPIDSPPPGREAIMANMAWNLSRQAGPGLAVDFLDGAMEIFRGSVNSHQAAWHRNTLMVQNERAPDLAGRFEQQREQSQFAALIETLKNSTIALRFGEFLLDESGTLPRQRKVMDHSDARQEFADHLRSAGFALKSAPIMDGKWRHAPMADDESGPSGRYRGFLDDRPNGQYIRSKQESTAQQWYPSKPLPALTDDERGRIDRERAAREADRKAAEVRAGKRAFAIWSQSSPVGSHPYLARKGVQAHGLRQDAEGRLLVPMTDASGFLHNIQTIDTEGAKLYQRDARKTGLFSLLGKIDPARPVLIAEGFATAATLREATGLPVAIAFDAGNLQPVAEAIRARHAGVEIILAADNDHHLKVNIGREKAEAAAKAVGGIVILPEFAPEERGSDWNDKGLQAVQIAFSGSSQSLREAARSTSRPAPPMGRHQAAEQARQKEYTRNQGIDR